MAECGWFPSPLLVVKCLELYRLSLNLYIVFYMYICYFQCWLNTKLWYKQTSDLSFSAN